MSKKMLAVRSHSTKKFQPVIRRITPPANWAWHSPRPLAILMKKSGNLPPRRIFNHYFVKGNPMKKDTAGNDVTRSVITETDVRNTVGRIFADGIILNTQYVMVSAGKNICQALGYPKEQLAGTSFLSIAGTLNEQALTHLLEKGFFEDEPITLTDYTQNNIAFTASGFYLGMIGDITDLIILKFKLADPAEAIIKQLSLKNSDLDNFIYTTSHSLRGPLATLKGLINLMTMEHEVDSNFIIRQMHLCADKLDDRLHKLIYFAESDKGQEFSNEQLTLDHISKKLQQTCAKDAASSLQQIQFMETLQDAARPVENGELILAMLQNIRAFFCRNATQRFTLTFRAIPYEHFNEFELTANDLQFNDTLSRKIDVVNVGYTEILTEPGLTDLYAAKKIVLKLKGHIKVTVSNGNATASILLPTGTT